MAAASVGPGREHLAELAEWLLAECKALGAVVETDVEATPADLDAARAGGAEVVLATGSRANPGAVPVDGPCPVLDPLELLAAGSHVLPRGPVLVHDPVGGPIGVGVAEWLAGSGFDVALVTPDQIAGTMLSSTGDLADANTRLQRAGVRRELRARLRNVRADRALLEDVWTGVQREVECGSLVDCSHRLPEESLYLSRPGTMRAGDCVAPRGVLEAVLEGRRMAMRVAGAAGAEPTPAAEHG